MSWLTRFKPNKTSFTAAAIASALAGTAILAIWSNPNDPAREMDRYGTSMAMALADTSAGYLLHADPINLAVITQHLTKYEEISGVVFFSVEGRIVARSGSTDSTARYTAAATLDDTMTGSVSVHLQREAFQTPSYWTHWGLSLLALLLVPVGTLGILAISARGNRSLPIISVPEPSATPQHAYLLVVNLHNQLALSREGQQQALQDALTMAQEVCALNHGIAVPIAGRGVALLLDASSVTAVQAVYASFLLQALLRNYETEGNFRCYLTFTTCPGNPAEVSSVSLQDLNKHADFEVLLPIAALARCETALISEDVYRGLNDLRQLAQSFTHPILEDLSAEDAVFVIEALPAQQAQLVDGQAEVILGFSQASA